MYLTNLIKALIDILTEVGDCQVFVTTENENKMYDSVLLHYIPSSATVDEHFLRLEGVVDNGEEKEDE